MYHVFSTGVTATILYLLSWLLYRFGFFSKNLHKRIWNIILVFIFIPVVFAGLFLALQVTYKWEIPVIKTILKWHVETGIAFSFTAIFHIVWHTGYFFTRYQEQAIVEPQNPVPAKSAKQYFINLFLIGFVSTAVQLLLMREMLNITGGYELIAGTFLASWLIGSAAGSLAAKRSLLNDIRKINLAFLISHIISLSFLIFLKRVFFSMGESPGFLGGMIYSLAVLLPCTFITGFTFIRILTIAGASGTMPAGKSFAVETSGGVLAGIAISTAGAGLLNTYQIFLIAVSVFAFYLLMSISGSKRTIIILNTLLATVIIVILIMKPDLFFRQLLLNGIKVEKTTDTPYGNITEGSYGGEKNLYYDHHLFRWQNDEAEREENIHYAMLQHRDPQKVLIVSGDIRSLMPEIMKYRVKSITFVERDPVLAVKYGMADKDGILRTESTDALRFIRRTSERFDVIIVNLPPPSTLLLNRFYTTEFFREAIGRLEQGGFFMCSPGTGSNYFNAESATLYSSVYNSMAAVFRNVVPVVGNKLYYIASDDSVTCSISSLVSSRGITNTYVNPDFLSDDLMKMKSEELVEIIDRNTRQNTLLFPIACFHFQNYRLTMENQQRIPSLVLLIVVFLFPLFTVRRTNLVMYGSAGALAGFEIIMLLVLQSSAGNMYQFTGIILAGFMAGLALGSGTDMPPLRWIGKFSGSGILILFYICIAFLISRLISINSVFLITSIILFLSLIPAFITGRLFRIMTEKGIKGSESSVYSSDMAGAALGFIAVSGIAIPLAGIRMTLFLLSFLILAGVLFGTVRDK